MMRNIQRLAAYNFLLIALIEKIALAYVNTIIQKPKIFISSNQRTLSQPQRTNTILSAVLEEKESSSTNNHELVTNIQKSVSILALSTSLLAAPIIANAAYESPSSSDYAGDTVSSAVRMLQEASGNREKTFVAYENIRDIITEGKGVGGSLSYSGVDLQRGEIADEDTTIYNPGLTLLTESEKNTLVQAIVQSRKTALSANSETSWDDTNESAYNFLKEKLDPFHLVEIKGYLSILPFWGAFLYLANIFVQQNARAVFQASYLLSVALVFGPIVALVVFGS